MEQLPFTSGLTPASAIPRKSFRPLIDDDLGDDRIELVCVTTDIDETLLVVAKAQCPVDLGKDQGIETVIATEADVRVERTGVWKVPLYLVASLLLCGAIAGIAAAPQSERRAAGEPHPADDLRYRKGRTDADREPRHMVRRKRAGEAAAGGIATRRAWRRRNVHGRPELHALRASTSANMRVHDPRQRLRPKRRRPGPYMNSNPTAVVQR